MIRFIIYRLMAVLLTATAAVILVLLCVRLMPGDPAEARLNGSSYSTKDLAAARAELGLDRPFAEQLLLTAAHLMQGDLGTSWASGQPVAVMVGQQLGPTLALASCAVVISLSVGLSLGIRSAIEPNNWSLGVLIALILASPITVIGTLIAWINSVGESLMPALRYLGLQNFVLPALVVGISLAGSIASVTKTALRESMEHPYVLMARAKGLSRNLAIVKHGLRVGLIPVVELSSLQAGFLISGTMITETLFARAGIGRLLVAGILSKDVPVVLAVVLLSTAAYSIARLLSDLLTAFLDPRMRSRTSSE